MEKRLSHYATFCTCFILTVNAVRFFVREPGRGMDWFFLCVWVIFGAVSVAILIEGIRRCRKTGRKRLLYLALLLILVTGFFLWLAYQDYRLLRQALHWSFQSGMAL